MHDDKLIDNMVNLKVKHYLNFCNVKAHEMFRNKLVTWTKICDWSEGPTFINHYTNNECF